MRKQRGGKFGLSSCSINAFVGADAHIGPQYTYIFIRADVGNGPYDCTINWNLKM